MELNDLISLLEYCISDKECRACPMNSVKGCVEELMRQVTISLKRLSSENKQLRNDLTMQTALAQNGQSAIETNRQLVQRLTAERDAAIEDLKGALKFYDYCELCKHNHKCEHKQCSDYIEGRGMQDEKGNYVDWPWNCGDFDWGTCSKLENTPCNGCFDNDMRGFEWRGCVRNE